MTPAGPTSKTAAAEIVSKAKVRVARRILVFIKHLIFKN
jgi:hypothetical protein